MKNKTASFFSTLRTFHISVEKCSSFCITGVYTKKDGVPFMKTTKTCQYLDNEPNINDTNIKIRCRQSEIKK